MSTVFEKHFDLISRAEWTEDKANIVVTYNPDPTGVRTLIETTIPAEATNPEFQLLLKKFSIDQINVMSNERDDQELANLKALVVEYAHATGLVYDPTADEPNTRLDIEAIFDLPDSTKGQDFLFEIKLRAFDIPEISNADQELKIAIREADTPIKVMYLVGKKLYE
jgi:dipeptidyl aminopeptidase/acylaminoacyl peptidase